MSPAALSRLLTVSYSCLAERADTIRAPQDEDVEVLVLLQGDHSRAVVPPRWDALVTVPGRGVARSRNAAIQFAGRRYLLFCDDDVQVRLDGVLAGVEHLRRTGAALALGRGVTPDGRLRKTYLAKRPTRLRLTNAAKAATYEMLVDVEQVRAAGLRFDERFGAGAPYYLGDEYLFIADLLRSGLSAHAVPYIFGMHPEQSSGSRWGGADLHVRAIVLNEVFGRRAAPARAAFAARRHRQMGGWRPALRFVLDRTVADRPEPRPPVPPPVPAAAREGPSQVLRRPARDLGARAVPAASLVSTRAAHG